MNQPWVYIVLFGLLLIVYAKLLPRTPVNSKESSGMKEVESAMDHFAVELEEQNKAIVQLFTDTKKDYDTHAAKLAVRVETLEKHNQQLQSELSRVGFVTEQIQKQQTATAPEAVLGTQLEANPSNYATAVRASDSSAAEAPVPSQTEADRAAVQVEVSEKPMNIRQRYAEVFQLYAQGKSIDVIAKKLDINKGEIALILQLGKQEESANVE
ncbi:hypothetical protein WMW72_20055 [Paenibacillus filicis]|uniref:Uncharacterized protein n=1 Tax=Paenibacillus filicis TaxID=669464 RepID=A0ABU9DQ38_9BACL